MARGGRRTGASGTAYAQRTDLTMPAVAPKGLPYGEHQQLVNDQKAVPVGGPPVAPSPQPQPGQMPPPPGTFPLVRPTERPNEPVTTGLPVGPGAGPEVLGPSSTIRMQDTLRQAAQTAGSSALARLADIAQSLGQ